MIKDTKNNKCCQGCGEKGTLIQPLWKAVWRVLKKLKVQLPYDPAIPFLRIYLKEFRFQ
jgi:hypothetical protein